MGRQKEMAELRGIVADHRLVTLTDAGGSGKTRLAVELAAQLAAEFCDGLWCVDLAPITDPVLVPVSATLDLNRLGGSKAAHLAGIMLWSLSGS